MGLRSSRRSPREASLRDGIEAQVAARVQRRQGRGRAPCQRPHAGDQLGEVKRLAEVVVGTQLEAGHTVADRVRGGEHQHTGVAAALHERAADLVAVHTRKIAVEHDDVVVGDRRVGDRAGTVEDEVDRHALTA